MELDEIISSFLKYGEEKEFFPLEDEIYVSNELLWLFKGTSFKKSEKTVSYKEAVKEGLEYAKEHDLCELDNLNQMDNFEAKIIDMMIKKPSEITKMFWEKYKASKRGATDWYYQFSKDTSYVKADRLSKNICYKYESKYAPLDITINLSKPEKDPKEIARLKTIKSSSYPLCALCKENEGFYGSYNQAGRSNHRIIPLKLDGDDFFFQYSPYGYFNEHCILLSTSHSPMKIDEKTFRRFVSFLDIFPDYLLGSNADLPIVGGSILTHEHYQGGRYVFPINKAKTLFDFKLNGFKDVKGEVVDWPMTDLRISSKDKNELIKAASKILACWREYSDPENDILACTDGEMHNTISPISRMDEGSYQFDLVLRNNRVSEEYPDGIFHPHKDKHHIKKENIGLIEVMGLAILPGRLHNELNLCSEYLMDSTKQYDSSIDKHLPWLNELKKKYSPKDLKEADNIIRKEVGLVFEGVLEDAGVYKLNPKGIEGIHRFVAYVNNK